MNAAERIIQQMPEKFTRKQILQCAKELGYSYSTANGVLDVAVYDDLCERIGSGVYRKLETEDEEPEPVDELLEDEWDEDFEYE